MLLQNLDAAFVFALDVTLDGNVTSARRESWLQVVGGLGAGGGADLLLLDSATVARAVLAVAECLKAVPRTRFLQLFGVGGVELLALPSAQLQLVLDEAKKHVTKQQGSKAAGGNNEVSL